MAEAQVADQPWKDKKTVQVAVGATLIIVFAWWMFTGDIPFLTKLMTDPPKNEDGKVQSINLLPIVTGMLVQACWIVGASAIGLFSGLWTAAAGAISRASQPAASAAALPAGQSSVQPTTKAESVASESPDGLMRGLVRAIATNDPSSKVKYETQIRKPYATSELVTALEDGDFETADERIRELKELAGVATQASSRAKGKAAS